MKARIDPKLCSGCDQCPDMCPSVFKLRGDLAMVHKENVPKDEESTCNEAANACPNQAIIIEKKP